jgi:phosphosulfolactate synthase (CoM biosynthesis protein A)
VWKASDLSASCRSRQVERYEDEGFKYHAELGISIQGSQLRCMERN